MTNAYSIEITQPDGSVHRQVIVPGVYSIGAESGNKIVLPDPKVSRRHAVLFIRPDSAFVEDLNSRNGTLIDGQAIHTRAELAAGQECRIGDYSIRVRLPEAAAPAPAAVVAPPIAQPAAPRQPEPARGLPRVRAIKRQIHQELLQRLDLKRLNATQIGDDDLHQRVQTTLRQIMGEIHDRLPSGVKAESLLKEIYDEAVGLGPLEDLLADESVTEIMVNGPNQIYVERDGRLERTERSFFDDSSVQAIIERIVSPIGRRIDESQPYVDARLKDGSRVNAIIAPLALNGPCITIRKFAKTAFTIDDFVRMGTLSNAMAVFLEACVLLRKNIVVSGGTGSGKTTLLNVISNYLPESDRIVTIEDAAELRLVQPHVIRLEARPPNIEGRGAISIRDLVRNALRMRPDRLIVGECRGGEALDMLQAMNTGHDGSLTTVHANSPRDVISRLETMVLMSGMDLPVRAIREQIAAAIDLVVHEARLSDGTRRVICISELVGLEGDRPTMQDIFEFKQTGLGHDGKVLGAIRATGSVPTFIEDAGAKGIHLPHDLFDPSAGV